MSMFVRGIRSLILTTAMFAVSAPSVASSFVIYPAGEAYIHTFEDALAATNVVKVQANNGNGNGAGNCNGNGNCGGNGNGNGNGTGNETSAKAKAKAKKFIGSERRESDDRRDAKSNGKGKKSASAARSTQPKVLPARMVPLPTSTFSKSELAPENSPRPRGRSRV